MLIRVFKDKTVELSILPISRIRPHEETIPALLDSLKRDLGRTHFQRDPILVDKKTHVALDGMHRRAALEALGANFAVCAEYDYLAESVKLERWLRYFIAPDRHLLSKILSMFQLRACESFREAARIVDSGTSGMGLLSADDSFVSEQKWDTIEIYQKIKKIDELCRASRIEIEFAPESAKFELFTSESVYVVYPTILSKEDVVQVTESNELFPCKTTRHIVPVRPMGIYFPLNDLRTASIEACEKKLGEIVNLSKIEVEQREVWYEGRTYSEPLAIFRKEK